VEGEEHATKSNAAGAGKDQKRKLGISIGLLPGFNRVDRQK
jgi:hypothetical protein